MTRAVRRLLLPALLSALCAALAVGPAPGPAAPAPVSVLSKNLSNSVGLKLVRIPAGKFTMGSPPGEPGRQSNEEAHEVEISRPFYLGAYLVTQGQYHKVVGSNPSYYCASGAGRGAVAGLDTSDFPVETVTWDDAVAFCAKLSALPAEKAARRAYRLPSEAEWEYACRAGTSTAYHFGNAVAAGQANCRPTTMNRTSKVGSYQPNGWGLYDMHGNVWHMCADWYDANYYRASPKKDPTGPAAGTTWVARGGSWSNTATACRSAHRAWVTRGQRNYLVGFRVACDIGGRPR
jgi:formylglycine-generating enzyme required for sulfatase activity